MEIGAGKPLVGFHPVNLNGYIWPRTPKLGHRNAAVKQERTRGARSRLRQFLSGENPERESGVNHMMWQARGGKQTLLDDGFDPDRLGERYAGIEIVERSPVIEIRHMDGMTSLSHLVREGDYSGCKSLRMMKQQHFGHR